jgi:hypothetical protein
LRRHPDLHILHIVRRGEYGNEGKAIGGKDSLHSFILAETNYEKKKALPPLA